MPGNRILVVDDAPQNVKLLRLILKDAGYRVLEAMNGAEALETVERERPDAVILDVRMPGMTGYEVCSRLRAQPQSRALPIIMVTALSMPEERIKGIEAGATDFITKPFNKRELLARLASSLQTAAPETKSAGIPVEEPVILADAQWRILEATPLAAGYLGFSSATARGRDLRTLLEQQAVTPPGDQGEEGSWSFQLRATGTSNDLTARATPVRAPDGRLIMRVIALRENSPRPS